MWCDTCLLKQLKITQWVVKYILLKRWLNHLVLQFNRWMHHDSWTLQESLKPYAKLKFLTVGNYGKFIWVSIFSLYYIRINTMKPLLIDSLYTSICYEIPIGYCRCGLLLSLIESKYVKCSKVRDPSKRSSTVQHFSLIWAFIVL